MTSSLSSSRAWFITALINFLAAGVLGLLLRLAFVSGGPVIEYGKTLQAHSHLAMLGWVYQGVFALFVHVILQRGSAAKRIFNQLFWITQLIVVLMTVSMLVFGYQHVTIIILGLHIVLSYVFAWHFWRELGSDRSYSAVLAMWALRFMILSTIALWALGPIMLTGMRGTALYYATIQFFLHFQLNGWFVFGALALFFRVLELNNIEIQEKYKRGFLFLLVVSCILTYAIAVTWSTPVPALFWVNSLGVALQLGALIIFLRMVLSAYQAARRSLGIDGEIIVRSGDDLFCA